MSGPRTIHAPTGIQLTCKSWLTEAAYRMIQNNLDPDVAERPQDLVVYGGRGQAARSWEAFDAILESLKQLEDDETLLVQSGKPVAIFKTHPDAPRVLIANSNFEIEATITKNPNLVFIAQQFIWMELFAQRIYKQLGTELIEKLEFEDQRIFEVITGKRIT